MMMKRCVDIVLIQILKSKKWIIRWIMTRQKMYDTNLRVRNYLLNEEKCTDVWFKKHTRRLDKTYTPNGFYFSRDLFNLFDGIALTEGSDFIIFFQAKTTNFPSSKPLNLFAVRF